MEIPGERNGWYRLRARTLGRGGRLEGPGAGGEAAGPDRFESSHKARVNR